jgi:hypothetical protein
MIGVIMTYDTAISKTREIASRVLAPSAGQNDMAARLQSCARLISRLATSSLFRVYPGIRARQLNRYVRNENVQGLAIGGAAVLG